MLISVHETWLINPEINCDFTFHPSGYCVLRMLNRYFHNYLQNIIVTLRWKNERFIIFLKFAITMQLLRNYHAMEHGSSAVECRTRNRKILGSSPLLLPFRSLGMFVLSTTPQLTQLYKWVSGYRQYPVEIGVNSLHIIAPKLECFPEKLSWCRNEQVCRGRGGGVPWFPWQIGLIPLVYHNRKALQRTGYCAR